MADELKYSKYFLNELPREQREQGFGKYPMFTIWTDDDIIKGSHCFSAMIMGPEATKVSHGPHLHKTPEVLVALGTDPENPKDLGATVELCMGPEMEVHTYSTSTLVYIPAKLIHCPFRVKEVKRGVLRLGTTKAYARYFMPFLVSKFHKDYPHIKIHLDEGSSLDMINSLVELKNEVAVIAKAADNPKVAFVPFSQEELVVILPTTHPLSRKKAVDFRELSKEPVIMKEVGSGTRKLVNELFIKNNCTPHVLMETSNSEFIKQLVQQGEGISFLVRAAVALELKEKKLATVPLKDQQVYLDVSFAYLKDASLSPPAKAFVGVLRKLWAGDIRPQDIGSLMAKILSQKK